MLLKLLKYLLNGFYMLVTFAFGIDKDVIKVYYHENVEFLCHDLIDILLERGWCVDQSKTHNLILNVAIAGPENHILFIAFPDPHLIEGINQMKLGKISSLT